MKIEFKTDDASLDIDKKFEVIKILESIIEDITYNNKYAGTILDIEGNKIGEWEL